MKHRAPRAASREPRTEHRAPSTERPGPFSILHSPFSTLHSSFFIFGSWLLVFLVAFLPRVLDLGQFATHDEVEFWLDRSRLFLRAIERGDYAATAISTHPGVTTMWLGSAGIVLRRTLFAWGWLQSDTFPLMLTHMRLPVALVHVAGILVGYGLLRRMLPSHTALLTALFWAADPFLIGYSRLLHVDALMATFATVSLLAACAYWHHDRHPATLILSAICAALAVVSKSPALALLPVITLVALTSPRCSVPGARCSVLGARCLVLGSWFVVFLITLLLVWPAIWANPLRVYELLRIGVEGEGAQPHMTGNFFLGQRQEIPGPLYYPVAVALRLTPWTLLGLLLLPLGRRAQPSNAQCPIPNPQSPIPNPRDLAALALFSILFIVAMSLFAKKFNRYLVPIFPSLDILAAVGWHMAMDKVQWSMQRHWPPVPRTRCNVVGSLAAACMRRGASYITPMLALAAIVNAAWWHPYSLAAFNQAFGGAQAGARTFAVGWGEGFDLAAAWLNEQPDITGVLVQSRMIKSLNPYLRKGAQAFFPDEGQLRENAGYVVVYISEVQGGPPLAPFDQFYRRAIPLHIVTIHDVHYAWIYQVPPPVPQPRPAQFAASLALRGFAREGTVQPGQPLLFKLFWTTSQPVPTNYWLFAHLLGPDGQRAAHVDIPYPTSQWQPGRYFTTDLLIPLPAALAPGSYQLIIGLYDPATGQRLRVQSAHLADPAIAGEEALLVDVVQVE